MGNNEKSKFMQSFTIWFGLGALMFGTQVGGSMAAGTYAAGYFATFGGGWLLVFIAYYFCARTFFSLHALEFIRMYKTEDYNSYYLELYGLNKPTSNPVLKKIVTVFFDINSIVGGTIITAATINLFGELMSSIFGMTAWLGRLIAIVLFAILSIYGASFLRKFNTVMTLAIVASLLTIIAAVMVARGDVFMERLGNFSIGPDWNTKSLGSHFNLLVSFSFGSAGIGATLCNFSDRIRNRMDSIGSSVMIGLLSISAFFMTSCIVLPFLPEMFVNTPILNICTQYLSPAITVFYWIVVVLSVVSTGPTFTYSTAHRFAIHWKTEKISRKTKLLILSSALLIMSYLVSGIGLMTLVQKGFSAMGKLNGLTLGVPIVISLFRMWRKSRREAVSAA